MVMAESILLWRGTLMSGVIDAVTEQLPWPAPQGSSQLTGRLAGGRPASRAGRTQDPEPPLRLPTEERSRIFAAEEQSPPACSQASRQQPGRGHGAQPTPISRK